MLEKISFDPKQLIQQSKGNNAFLKRLVKEEIDSQEYPIYLLIENTEDELRLLEEERNWILFWMGIVVILNLYLNLVHQEIVLPTMVLGNIGLILSALLLGFYFKKNAFIGAYRLILDVLDRYQQNQLKAIRLSSMYLDIKHFFQDFEKKIDLYGKDCKCYVYYRTQDGKNYYTGYSLCESSIWDEEREEMLDTIDKVGIMTIQLQDAYELFKSQIRK